MKSVLFDLYSKLLF